MGSGCTLLYPGMLAAVQTWMMMEGVASIDVCWRYPSQEFAKQESEVSEEIFSIGDSWDTSQSLDPGVCEFTEKLFINRFMIKSNKSL